MTAGLSVRGHDARAYTITDLPTTAPNDTALPSTGFTVPAPAPFGFVPHGLDRRAAPAEGDTDARTLIDNLVAGAVGGDVRARDDLLALIHPLVLKYCRARLGRQESLMSSADDVAQDVCMAVVSALPNYQLKGLSFRAFVYGIAAHKVTDAFRAIGRNRAEPVAELPDGPVTADGPEHRLLAAEMSARLGKLLSHLTPRQREVLVLRLAVGLSAEETAQAVRSTPGAVRVTQHRALGRLRKILLGESGARGIAAAERFHDEPAPVTCAEVAAETDDTCADPAGSGGAGHRSGRGRRRRLRNRRDGGGVLRRAGAGRCRPGPAQADPVQARLNRSHLRRGGVSTRCRSGIPRAGTGMSGPVRPAGPRSRNGAGEYPVVDHRGRRAAAASDRRRPRVGWSDRCAGRRRSVRRPRAAHGRPAA